MMVGLVLYDKKGYREFDRAEGDATLYTYHPQIKEDEILFSPTKPGVQLFRIGPPFEWLVSHLLSVTDGEPLSFVSTRSKKQTVHAEMVALKRAGLIGPDTQIRR